MYDFLSGELIELEAKPAPGYRFVNWSGGSNETSETIHVEMTCDKNITAVFTEITYTLTVDASPSIGGKVIVESPQPAEGYVVGTEVTLTAVASEGYQFGHWSGAAPGSENQTTIIMDSGKELIANFIELSLPPFAWWWIVVGVVLIGLLLYFLTTRNLGSREK